MDLNQLLAMSQQKKSSYDQQAMNFQGPGMPQGGFIHGLLQSYLGGILEPGSRLKGNTSSIAPLNNFLANTTAQTPVSPSLDSIDKAGYGTSENNGWNAPQSDYTTNPEMVKNDDPWQQVWSFIQGIQSLTGGK